MSNQTSGKMRLHWSHCLYTIPHALLLAALASAFIGFVLLSFGLILVQLYTKVFDYSPADMMNLFNSFFTLLPVFNIPETIGGYPKAAAIYFFPFLSIFYLIFSFISLFKKKAEPDLSNFDYYRQDYLTSKLKVLDKPWTLKKYLENYSKTLLNLSLSTEAYYEKRTYDEWETYILSRKILKESIDFYKTGNTKIFWINIKETLYSCWMFCISPLAFAFVTAFIGIVINVIRCLFLLIHISFLDFIFKALIFILAVIIPVFYIGCIGIFFILNLHKFLSPTFLLSKSVSKLKRARNEYVNSTQNSINMYSAYMDFRTLINCEINGKLVSDLICFDKVKDSYGWIDCHFTYSNVPYATYTIEDRLHDFFKAFEYTNNLDDIDKYLKIMTRVKLGGFDEEKSKQMIDSVINEIKKDPKELEAEKESILIDIAPVYERIVLEEQNAKDELDQNVGKIELGGRYMFTTKNKK